MGILYRGDHHYAHVSRLRSWVFVTCNETHQIPCQCTLRVCFIRVPDNWRFLGKFSKLRTAAISFFMSFCSSVRPHGTTRLSLDGFSWNLIIFRKSVKKIQFSLKSDKNDRYFTWRPLYIFIIYRPVLLRMRNFLDEIVEKTDTHTLCWEIFFFGNFAVCEIMWQYVVEPGRPQITMWHMRVACWVPKPKNTFQMCTMYCYFTATIVVRTHLTVTLFLHFLSCHYIWIWVWVVGQIREACFVVNVSVWLKIKEGNL
jgi:hypothetical protein